MSNIIWSVAAIVLLQVSNSSENRFPFISEGKKTIVSESVFRYLVLRYEPVIKVARFNKPEQCSQITPEETLISMVSAMANLDYVLWSHCWKSDYGPKDDPSTRNDMLSAWRRVVVGKQLSLRHRIETGRYVLIEYALEPLEKNLGSDAPGVITNTVTLEKVNDKWQVTNELASDPVRLFWEHPEYRPQVIVR